MRLWIEAWSPEYGTSFDVSGSAPLEDRSAELVNEVAWGPVAPTAAPAPGLAFLDGVSRVDARVFADTGGAPSAGLCGSVGVGAMLTNGSAKFGPCEVHRAAVFEPGRPVAFPPVSGSIAYQERPARGDRPEDVRAELERLRAEKEAALAAQLAGQGWVVIADGRLQWLEPMSVVGYIKSHHRHYLFEELEKIVPELQPGERTPLFALGDRHLSWYLCLARPGAVHPWAGVVRCEVSAQLGVDRALELADLTASQLPRFASPPFWDSRSPQNLVPIATLERRLWHLLGDRELVLRRIRAAVARMP
ncbi:MAG: hypothetical protein ACRDJU_07535 [Actinomycetota bacterium]